MGLFLYIPTIRGDATEVDHQGEIELSSFQFAEGRPNSPVGGSLTVREMSVSKEQGSSSTTLFKAAVSGEMFPFMIVDLVNSGGTMRMTMTLVALASFSMSGAGTESFSLNFEKITFEHI